MRQIIIIPTAYNTSIIIICLILENMSIFFCMRVCVCYTH
jgi:hypothetical protein